MSRWQCDASTRVETDAQRAHRLARALVVLILLVAAFGDDRRRLLGSPNPPNETASRRSPIGAAFVRRSTPLSPIVR